MSIKVVNGEEVQLSEDEAAWVAEKDAAGLAEIANAKITLYRTNRRIEYPAIGDQLDMLWHAMDTGEIAVCKEFYNTLKAVKEKYPK